MVTKITGTKCPRMVLARIKNNGSEMNGSENTGSEKSGSKMNGTEMNGIEKIQEREDLIPF